MTNAPLARRPRPTRPPRSGSPLWRLVAAALVALAALGTAGSLIVSH